MAIKNIQKITNRRSKMRLIDADKLSFYCNYEGDCSGDISRCQECSNYVLDYRDIKNQPTAYDIDSVVEQLKQCYGIVRSTSVDYAEGLKDAYERFIGIVKIGGRNEID